MAAVLIAVLLGAVSALELDAPGVSCPDVAAVRASLDGLGIDLAIRDGHAAWSTDSQRLRLHLHVESKTASVAITDRELLLGAPCSELADAVALSIERATSPL